MTPRVRMPSPTTRRYLYRVVSAGVILAVGYGVIEQGLAPAWLALAAAVTGSGELAVANLPGEEAGDDT